MTIEHMALVFAAEDLSPSEKLLLLAGANLCTQKGTFAAGIERLTGMTGMSASTVKRTRRELSKRGLMKAKRRNNGGEMLDNAYLIDAAALAALCPAEPRGHDDDAFAALFAEDDAKTRPDLRIAQSDPFAETASDLRIAQSDPFAETGDLRIAQSDPFAETASDLLIGHHDPHKEEEDLNTPPPTPSIADGREFVDALPAPVLAKLTELHRARLAKLAAVALGAGHDRVSLARFVAGDLDGARSLYAVMARRLREDLPAEPLAPPAPPKPRPFVVVEPPKPVAPASRSAFVEPGITFMPSRLRKPSQGHAETSEPDSVTTTHP
jgi:hypothetical protein